MTYASRFVELVRGTPCEQVGPAYMRQMMDGEWPEDVAVVHAICCCKVALFERSARIRESAKAGVCADPAAEEAATCEVQRKLDELRGEIQWSWKELREANK